MEDQPPRSPSAVGSSASSPGLAATETGSPQALVSPSMEDPLQQDPWSNPSASEFLKMADFYPPFDGFGGLLSQYPPPLSPSQNVVATSPYQLGVPGLEAEQDYEQPLQGMAPMETYNGQSQELAQILSEQVVDPTLSEGCWPLASRERGMLEESDLGDLGEPFAVRLLL